MNLHGLVLNGTGGRNGRRILFVARRPSLLARFRAYWREFVPPFPKWQP